MRVQSIRDRWLVTGASGQLGSELVKVLETSGCDVIGLGRNDLDISENAHVTDVIMRVRPMFVINTAAFTDVDGAEACPDTAFRVNARGASNLASSVARLRRGLLVHLSTDYVFGSPGEASKPWGESDPVNPLNEYGRSKAEGELAVRKRLPDRGVIVRTAWLYAPGSKNFVSTMVERALAGTTSCVVNDQWGQPTWTRDVAESVVDLASRLGDGRAPAGTYHATNSGRATWFDLARRVYERAGADMELVTPIVSMEISRAAVRPPWSVLGHDAWSNAGMRPPRPWEEALDEALPLFLQAETSSS